MTLNPLRWFRRKRDVLLAVERDGFVEFPGVNSRSEFEAARAAWMSKRTYTVTCFQCGRQWAEFTMGRIDWSAHRCTAHSPAGV